MLDTKLAQALSSELPADVAGPIRAGMRARTVADACARYDLAALLIDATGRVIHVTERARTILAGGDFELVEGQLLGRDRTFNAAIVKAIGIALTDPKVRSVEPSNDHERMITGMPFADPSPFQRLKGVLILGSSHSVEAVAGLRSALSALS